jgi:hypothetical protein
MSFKKHFSIKKITTFFQKLIFGHYDYHFIY